MILCLVIIHWISESWKTRKFYKMTTSCEQPKRLPKGYRGFPMFYYEEEASLVFND